LSEKIIVTGTSGWCSDAGTEIIYTPEDQPNDCGCAEGFVELDPPNEDGEPVCGYDFGEGDSDGGGNSEPPTGGGGGGTNNTPTKPTVQQCQQMNAQCMQNANALTQDCKDGRTQFNHQQLANGKACHDQSLEDLLDGFRYRILWMTYACTPADFGNINSVYTDNCRKQAIRRGMDRCQYGLNATSSTVGNSETFTFSFKSPVFEIGGEGSDESSFTIETPFGAGANQICMAKGTKAADQCSSDLSACNAAASQQGSASPMLHNKIVKTNIFNTQQTFASSKTKSKSKINNAKDAHQQRAADLPNKVAPPTIFERLRSQIDVKRLGLNNDNKPVSSRLFKPLSIEYLEIPELYLHRLQFLADWSHFLRRNNVSDADLLAMHKILQREQFKLQSEYFTEASIVEAVFEVNMQTGEAGTDALRNLLDMYRSRDGVRRQMVSGHFRVLRDSKVIFGDTIGAEFNEKVWPGMLTFGFSAPFAVQVNTFSSQLAQPKLEEPVAK